MHADLIAYLLSNFFPAHGQVLCTIDAKKTVAVGALNCETPLPIDQSIAVETLLP